MTCYIENIFHKTLFSKTYIFRIFLLISGILLERILHI